MNEERAVLAGSCCWGMKQIFGNLEGVVSTRAGHTDSSFANTAYNHQGFHAGAVEILFDPRRVSYRAILDLFFQIHDPTTQGDGDGSGCRSSIFYTSEEQQRIALDTIADVDDGKSWPGPVLTEVVAAGSFWEAHPAQIAGGHTCHLARLHRKLPASMTINA